MPTADKEKQLNYAWERFSSRMNGVRTSLSKITDAIKKRRRRNRLKEAWARFKFKMADIRRRTFGLMINMDKKRSAEKIEDVRRNILNM